ncbi:MAG: GDP-mannose 4,6-dehydratase [Candidatus Omnitrophica bacterium]|nr:GDP-mannose 4,6-dehydratase [Candidatus Omnitrophota bacterium]
MSKKALITGITGQDGSYLAEFLLSRGYKVHGVIRRSSSFNTERIDHLYEDPHAEHVRLRLHYGDLTSFEQTAYLIQNVSPDEIYHLGAQSHVRVSFDMPEYTGQVTGLGTTRILEALRISRKRIKFYNAASSEMFGMSPGPQNEEVPFCPRSPYAAAKLYGYWMTVNYRQGYDIFACNGIMFNHESPRRGETFVSRKITRAVAAIKAGKQEKLYLGNLQARRDWGYAPEYVEAMWRMMQKDRPGEYVIGTGHDHTVEEFVRAAFKYVGLKYETHVEIDPRYFRPTEVEHLVADARKAREALDWTPKISFQELVKIMVDADMRAAGLNPPGDGDRILHEKFPERWWNKD